MKKWTIFFVFSLMINSIVANSQNKDTYSKDISFKRVEVDVGMTCSVYFRDVSVLIKAEDLVIDVDKVDVRLLENSTGNYMTLDILNYNTGSSNADSLYTADKVTVVVRNKKDYKLWNDFLKKAKKKRDAYIKNSLQPVRVIPPEP